MSKNYIVPAIKVKEMNAESLLAGSGETLPLVDDETINNESEILSKENHIGNKSLWED
ncbi:hypothetical protein [Prevotella dentasini]|uniref:hypothetical protein n=1 Tax=Prevotella dentasini TaxID=589537 RepID=UPI000AD98374|nr:hypothetical protein [Prevotella dentasini]